MTGEALEFSNLLNACYTKKWVVYVMKPFRDPLCVLKYIGRYTHRVAISNKRIIGFSNGNVSFLWKDYKDKNKIKVMTLTAPEFMRRFLLHVLPEEFKRIRFYGILSNRYKNKNIEYIRHLLCDPEIQPLSPLSLLEPEVAENRCPRCKSENIQISELPPEDLAEKFWNSA